MADSNDTPEEETTHQVSTVGAIAIGFIETFTDDQIDLFIKFAENMGNEGVVTELKIIVESIRTKLPINEQQVLSLAFMILLAERSEPEGQGSDIILDA